MADRCSFCGSTAGPFNKVGGLFTVEQKAAANRQLIVAMCRRWLPARRWRACTKSRDWAWLERQAEVMEDLVAERQAATKRTR